MAKTPALERIRQLNDERQKLTEEAKQEALQQAKDAIQVLNELGYNYQLANGSKPAASARKGTRTVKDQPCKICGFKTNPPHDPRAHKAQYPNTKPFTKDELAGRNLVKV